ncbi:replication initiation protein [Acidithiobacillus ferrooxidans]|uniref:replication initiation protein n=1 Tax=Acidithiobacillus ferrooxidans TaxID=920 RepID=UPI000A3E0A8A|nr:replication initiation protein [Acidithiobacillus ferrooxidans]
MAGYVGWAAILKCNHALSTDNLRRALKNSTDSQDISELQELLDSRLAGYRKKAAANVPPLPTYLHPLLQLVIDRMPEKPYFSSNIERGIRIRDKAAALRHREIQVNQPWARQCLVLDIDHEKPLSGLPPPNVIVTNLANWHRHALIVWETPVLVGPAASQRAQNYYKDIARAIGECWHSDQNYTGLLMHNPLHPHWRTEIFQSEPYQLADFRDALRIVREMPTAANHPRFKGGEWADQYAALGRNCATWEACRWPAYSMGRNATFDAVLRLVESYNATHNSPPLGHRECRHIALSISNYVLAGKRKGHSMTDTDWRQWVEHTHTPEVQARRGALGGKASGKIRRAASEQERATARLIRASGSSYGVISQVLGIPESTIKRWCKN